MSAALPRWRKAKNQAELDQIIADGDWAEVRGSATVSASGSATVSASGSATVRAYGSATVRASDSATVSAYDSATVSAYDSATVRAYGSATVRAYDSATVRAYGSATVRAYGSATVRASDSATVRAYGSATVSASGSATVRAYGSATVSASGCVAIHRLSKRAHLNGGVIIDLPDLTTPNGWLDYFGIPIASDGTCVLYKGVNDEWLSERGARYRPGDTPEAPDWDPTPVCGGGLHLSPRATATWTYCSPKRYVACTVLAAEVVPILSSDGVTSDKVKVRRVLGCVEVDEADAEIPAQVTA